MNRLRYAILSACLLAFSGSLTSATAGEAGSNVSTKSSSGAKPAPATPEQGEFFRYPAAYLKDFVPNTMTDTVTPEAKKKAIQSMMMANPLSLRDMMSLMVTKKQVKEGVSFDEAVESMKLRANARNFKFIGVSPLYKDVMAVTGKPSPRAEIYSFCDSVTARKVLDYSPEFIAFLPCRIAILEDSKGKIWVVTLDWDVTWMDHSQNPNKLSDDVRARAIEIRETLEDVMTAAANGDL